MRAASGRVAQLNASVAVLARRLGAMQTDIDAKSAELDKLRVELTAARTRLGRLEGFEAHAEQVLAQQLVGSYESAPPDIVTVVLSATGFQDLLNRLAFMQRVRRQDASIVSQVRSARRAVSAQATRLGRLQVRQQTLTEEVVAQRNQLAQTSASLDTQRAAVARFRDAKAGQLASARTEMSHLQHQLHRSKSRRPRWRRGQPRRRRARRGRPRRRRRRGSAPVRCPRAASRSRCPRAPPPRRANGRPTRASTLSAPGNTPEYAVCSGTIVLHGIGGLGPWTPVLRCDRTLAGYGDVDYGHGGPVTSSSSAPHVTAGRSSRDRARDRRHLDRSPPGDRLRRLQRLPDRSQTAATMMSLLHARTAASCFDPPARTRVRWRPAPS